MSTIGTEAINESRADAIGHAGDHLHNLSGCKD